MPATAERRDPVPLPFKSPESVVDPVPPFDTESVPVKRLKPIDVVATTDPFTFVERIAFGMLEIAKVVEVAVVRVVPPLKMLVLEKVLLVVVEKREVKTPVVLL